MSEIRQQLNHQKESNKASIKFFNEFGSHRRSQTDLILDHLGDSAGRICILGAGNCYDIELETVGDKCNEIHLVDIDRDALLRARSRVPSNLQKKIHLHAPLDVSCVNKRLSRWRNFELTEEELISFPDHAIAQLQEKLSVPFDCVVSACLVSQLLFTLRNFLTEQHPLLEAITVTTLITHLRALVALGGDRGKGLFITDISSNEIAPLPELREAQDNISYLQQRISNNQIFTFLDPSLLASLVQQDPYLNDKCIFSDPLASWLWHNGPGRTFMVYACTLTRTTEHIS